LNNAGERAVLGVLALEVRVPGIARGVGDHDRLAGVGDHAAQLVVAREADADHLLGQAEHGADDELLAAIVVDQDRHLLEAERGADLLRDRAQDRAQVALGVHGLGQLEQQRQRFLEAQLPLGPRQLAAAVDHGHRQVGDRAAQPLERAGGLADLVGALGGAAGDASRCEPLALLGVLDRGRQVAQRRRQHAVDDDQRPDRHAADRAGPAEDGDEQHVALDRRRLIAEHEVDDGEPDHARGDGGDGGGGEGDATRDGTFDPGDHGPHII
jgi:hypothetical protein